MSVRNVVFDVGGVLLSWDPPTVIAQLHPDLAQQATIRRQMFEHADWHEFDRGTLTESDAATHFAKLTGLSVDETQRLIDASRESLQPIPGTVALVDELAAAGVRLYLLSNMPVGTFEYLVPRNEFFAQFEQLVISGSILMIKPDPAIYRHLVEHTGIVPAESVFVDDLPRNVVAARECGLHAIQFRDPQSCRAELRGYLPGIGL